jgi:acylphosphatase
MWVLQQARSLGLSGFVRNNADGTVYLEAEGETECVMQLIALCSQGPARSQIADVSSFFMPVTDTSGFFIR